MGIKEVAKDREGTKEQREVVLVHKTRKERRVQNKASKFLQNYIYVGYFPPLVDSSKKNPSRPNIAEDKTHESGAKHNFHLKTNRFGQNKREKSKLNIASHAIA